MTPLMEKIAGFIDKARRIHSQERDQVVESILIIRALAHWRAELYVGGGKHEVVAQKIALTPDQYFKRLRVARLSERFPKALDYLREGRTCVSHLALIGDRISKANEQVIWDHILDKGRREVEDFLRRVQLDGTVKDEAEELITLKITVTPAQEAMIHRLTEVLSARGQVPSTAEAIVAAVDKLLEQKDEMRRAARLATKDEGREGAEAAAAATVAGQLPRGSASETSPATGVGCAVTQHRRRIPAVVRRAVFRQAQGRCQHVMADGKRCGATRMLEIDHRVPVTRGGSNDVGNLALVCREHNQYRARLILGHETMDRYQMGRRE